MKEKRYKTMEGKCDHCGQELIERFLTNMNSGTGIVHKFYCVNSDCLWKQEK